MGGFDAIFSLREEDFKLSEIISQIWEWFIHF